MRYYHLQNGSTGRSMGSYAIPQLGMDLVLMDEPPSSSAENNWQWTGSAWERTPESLTHEASDLALATKKSSVAQAISTLRQWKTDADTAVAAWGAQTQTGKNATMKDVISRFGTLCDRLADFIQVQRIDQ